MPRLARAEVFDPSEVAILHICARVVRRCFLFGVDPFTGKNHDHRKRWIEDQLKWLAANFGLDLNSIRNDPDKLRKIRIRQSDASWWMRLLCQNIGKRANQEDEQATIWCCRTPAPE